MFGQAYKCPEGYTPLMVACHRGRWVHARARGGADTHTRRHTHTHTHTHTHSLTHTPQRHISKGIDR